MFRQSYRHVLLVTAITLAVALAGCASTSPRGSSRSSSMRHMSAASTATQAEVVLASASASLVSGKLSLVPMGDGVNVKGDIGGFRPGSSHGFHIHEKGDCSAADASSAGGHFNPTGQAHGRAMQGVHNAGDSPPTSPAARSWCTPRQTTTAANPPAMRARGWPAG